MFPMLLYGNMISTVALHYSELLPRLIREISQAVLVNHLYCCHLCIWVKLFPEYWCWCTSSFFLQASVSSASPPVWPMWRTFFTSTLSANCSWVSMYHPANKPWPLGIQGDVFTCGLMFRRCLLMTTPETQSLPCPALWIRCPSWTGIMTCCPSLSFPCR